MRSSCFFPHIFSMFRKKTVFFGRIMHISELYYTLFGVSFLFSSVTGIEPKKKGGGSCWELENDVTNWFSSNSSILEGLMSWSWKQFLWKPRGKHTPFLFKSSLISSSFFRNSFMSFNFVSTFFFAPPFPSLESRKPPPCSFKGFFLKNPPGTTDLPGFPTPLAWVDSLPRTVFSKMWSYCWWFRNPANHLGWS